MDPEDFTFDFDEPTTFVTTDGVFNFFPWSYYHSIFEECDFDEEESYSED